MKTTLNLNDHILRRAKRRAARDGVTLTRFVEDALRTSLIDPEPCDAFKLELKSGARPRASERGHLGS